MTAVLSTTEYQQRLASYACEGKKRAQQLGNRGPIRFDDHGKLHSDIVRAYWEHGFYVFTSILSEAEVNELRSDVMNVLEHAPDGPGQKIDANGEPAVGIDMKRYPYHFVKPLSDPVGGTASSEGRHMSKMAEASPGDDAPEYVIQIIAGMCQLFDSGLRVYGHPQLLAVAEAINGPDFVPYNDAIFVKQPGLGGSVAWHQDGVTHWNSPDWDEGIHGVNFQAQLNETSPVSCLWVVPGTHKLGRVDIKAMVEANGGSDQLPDAIPLYCEPGDVTIVNRQTLHCSFANTSDDFRISVSWGMHRRAAVLGQHGHLLQPKEVIYDDDFVDKRASVIQVAIDARRQYYPDESSFEYLPFRHVQDEYRWSPNTFESVIRDYNTRDIGI
ncbi:MAG: phytanoyl-CoA dioxygenase family protein [Gammaproteobacteria bacterium]|nr:phytanoyl-CoA dioxygenase family protein [Gammaproteobacteria bacterium]